MCVIRKINIGILKVKKYVWEKKALSTQQEWEMKIYGDRSSSSRGMKIVMSILKKRIWLNVIR